MVYIKAHKINLTLLRAAVLFFVISFLLFPGEGLSGAREGLSMCFNTIIPSLFPFFRSYRPSLSTAGWAFTSAVFCLP